MGVGGPAGLGLVSVRRLPRAGREGRMLAMYCLRVYRGIERMD